MAIQIAPIAGIALRYGVVALAAYLASRRLERGRLSQPVEDEMDSTQDGLTLTPSKGQVNATGRLRRIVRLGAAGPGVAVDATLMGRFRMERV